jgi:glycosyltransferase involved in cell wall biosynthesis
VVVVDDCSTDETDEVIAKYASDPRMVYHRHAQNVGMVRNHGEGVGLARGRYVTFVADDDEVGPDFLARRVAAFEADDSLVAVYSAYAIRRRDGSIAANRVRTPAEFQGFDLLRAVITHDWFIGGALYRRDAVAETWPELTEDGNAFDFGLNLRLALRPGARAARLSLDDYFMTEHEGQYSNQERIYADHQRVLAAVARRKLDWTTALVLRREIANSLTVWGRALACQGREREARGRFLRAILHDPLAHWPWRQLARSMLWPFGLARFS